MIGFPPHIRQITAAFLLVIFWGGAVAADDKKPNLNDDPIIQQEAKDFIQQLADRALTSLHREHKTLEQQETRFREILTEGFNVNYIGKISLGRHRKKASRHDLEIYYALFPEYLVKVYTSRLTKLDTRDVQVKKVLPNGKRDMYVRTRVTDNEKKFYDVDWRVRPDKKNDKKHDKKHDQRSYKIIDVKIEGISMARTQRDDFSSRISESGISGLINYMKSIIDGTVVVAENEKPENTE